MPQIVFNYSNSSNNPLGVTPTDLSVAVDPVGYDTVVNGTILGVTFNTAGNIQQGFKVAGNNSAGSGTIGLALSGSDVQLTTDVTSATSATDQGTYTLGQLPSS